MISGIVLSAGGSIVNAGMISGGYLVAGIALAPGGSIVNTGTIAGGGGEAGIFLTAGDTVANAGMISGGDGGDGIFLVAGGSVANGGMISGGGPGPGGIHPFAAGVYLRDGGVVTNGSAGNRTALITGTFGINAFSFFDHAGVTIINFGTIASTDGTGGQAVRLDNAKSVLVLEGGSQLVGEVRGGGGTLDLDAGGPGALSGLGSQYAGFAQVAVLAGANWTLEGANTIGSGKTLTVLGSLTVLGTLTASGGGLIKVTSGGRQIVESGGVENGATVTVGGDQTVSSGGTARGTVVSGGAQYVRGTASGTLVYRGGSENVHGVASGGTVNSGGRQQVIAGGVASAVTVKAGGDQYVQSGGSAVGTVLRGGTEYVSSGGAASGTIVRSGGKEIVRPGGTANATTISGGFVEVTGGAYVSARLFTFAGGGTLQLDRSVSFKGQIAGFGIPDRIDLLDIAFVSGTTKAGFVEASGHTSGTLSVTDGTHTAKLTLLGSYVASRFHLASDGHGGTLVTDPPVPGGGAAQTNFSDIAPAGLPSRGADPGNPAQHLPAGAIEINDPAHGAGDQTLLPTGPPGGLVRPSGGGTDHNLSLPPLR